MLDSQPRTTKEERKHRREFLLLQACFIVLGIGYLFPFSALFQAYDYWRWLFEQNIEFDLNLMFWLVNILSLSSVVLFFSHSSITKRILVGFVGQFICISLLPFTALLKPAGHPAGNALLALLLTLTGVLSFMTALLDSAILAFGAQFSQDIQQALQVGVGVSTLIGAIYRDVTKACFSRDEGLVASTILNFAIGSATLMGCTALFVALIRSDLYHKHQLRNRRKRKVDEEGGDRIDAIIPINGSSVHTDSTSSTNFSLDVTPSSESESGLSASLLENSDQPYFAFSRQSQRSTSSGEETGTARRADSTDSWSGPQPPKASIAMKVGPHLCVLMLIFVVSFGLFPALITTIPAYSTLLKPLNKSQWYQLLQLTWFAVCDTIGRFLCHIRFGLTLKTMPIVVLARFALYPLMIALATGRLASDLLTTLSVAILGFTNGHTTSLIIILITEFCSPKERQYAATLQSFSLNAGLLGGSVVGFVVAGLTGIAN
ncbi:unnamed protein product [Vitrella brassicaformis CCMP3155]|uniref:Major facilitator superfamily (MFS) profile domain-containing protein n=1 Tax=Vitrella brassicaformis (strain CCMP3155) TaxID=1169540 RepID=A0A0G4FR29_VITBC|nr:unnamed protein product [Vitrella brassicaformis CCMP3155]|eukprot:CEM16681.1 unnamed protein product [Vitrella brassicaformis CCMP3155]